QRLQDARGGARQRRPAVSHPGPTRRLRGAPRATRGRARGKRRLGRVSVTRIESPRASRARPSEASEEWGPPAGFARRGRGAEPPEAPLAALSVARLVGNTPLVEIRHVRDGVAPGVRILAKLEGFNPGGSVKDRPALKMIEDGLARGLLVAGKTIIDSTSGNT